MLSQAGVLSGGRPKVAHFRAFNTRHSVVQVLRQCGFRKRHRSRSGEEVLFVRTRAVEAC